MKGYKVFNSDWTCRGFQYEVGKTYEHEGKVSPCSSGFHFCEKAADCFAYYRFDSDNKVAEVEALGEIKTDGNKSVTDKIKIVRELSWYEVLEIVNIGKDNTGNCNTGYCNAGNYNTGNYNAGDCNSGFFCTITPNAVMFNKPTEYTHSAIYYMPGMRAIRNHFILNKWVDLSDMADKEKPGHPGCETCGGYLKTYGYKEAWENAWDKMTGSERESVKTLPNFDPDIFYEITGIRV
nr:MAG TPA: hypothetical protein [Caudoviricetes sp.]